MSIDTLGLLIDDRSAPGVEDVLIKMGEFIFSIDFVVFDTERMPHILVILGCHFLATFNTLINCRNGMTKLSFDNITLDFNIFNLQRQPNGFDDADRSTLNWVSDFSYDELEFEHSKEFAIEYESFFMNNRPEYDVFDFDDVHSMDFVVDVVSICHTYIISLDRKPLADSLKYFFGF